MMPATTQPLTAATPSPAAAPGACAAPAHRPFALVLAGGGARGLAHAGALRALQRDGYRPSALVGVSMGAIVAAAFALNPEWYQDLLALDSRGLPEPTTPRSRDALERWRALLASERLIRTMLLGWGAGERSRDHALHILQHLTRDRQLEEADPPLTIVATDLRSGRRVALSRGSAARAAYASAALAGVLPPLEVDGKLLADGGYADLAPVDLARGHGVDRVIAIDPYQDTSCRDPRTGLEAMVRAVEICHYRHAALRLARADLVVRPTFPFQIDTLDFRALRSAIAAGARAVRRERGHLRRALLRETRRAYAHRATAPDAPRRDTLMGPDDTCHAAPDDTERDECYVAPLQKTVDPERIVERAEARLALAGLGCPNCAARVRNALLALDGVIEAEVTLAPQRAVVAYDPTRTLPERLAEAVYWAGAASRHAYHADIVEVRNLAGAAEAPTHA